MPGLFNLYKDRYFLIFQTVAHSFITVFFVRAFPGRMSDERCGKQFDVYRRFDVVNKPAR